MTDSTLMVALVLSGLAFGIIIGFILGKLINKNPGRNDDKEPDSESYELPRNTGYPDNSEWDVLNAKCDAMTLDDVQSDMSRIEFDLMNFSKTKKSDHPSETFPPINDPEISDKDIIKKEPYDYINELASAVNSLAMIVSKIVEGRKKTKNHG